MKIEGISMKINGGIAYLSKLVIAFFVVFIIVFTILTYVGTSNKYSKEQRENCIQENELAFEGVITEYNGQGAKSSPTVFMLGDSIYTLPRYNIDMGLNKGDTIKKIKGEHKYYLRRTDFSNRITGKRLDTVVFNCK